jgi:8-oxo-dGTP pyrophosphatase MutT (NUDIX family)
MNEAVPVRPAATVLLVRDGASGLEVFMVVRHHKIDFASGALVFPGGSVDPGDRAIASAPAPRHAAADLTELDRISRVAAIRETFEECGVLLARPAGLDALLEGARTAEFATKWQGRSFGELVGAEGLELAIDVLIPFAHWITPPMMPKRFDTRFYITTAPSDQIAVHDGSESVDSVWINPARAFEDAAAGKYTIVLATRLNLRMLTESADVASALAAARARRIITVEPIAIKTEKGYTMRIPAEAGYGGELFEN